MKTFKNLKKGDIVWFCHPSGRIEERIFSLTPSSYIKATNKMFDTLSCLSDKPLGKYLNSTFAASGGAKIYISKKDAAEQARKYISKLITICLNEIRGSYLEMEKLNQLLIELNK